MCNYIHYIEYLLDVPYRYKKKFKGVIKINGKSYKDEYEFNVRYLNKNVITSERKLEKYLLNKNLMNRASLGWNYISTVKIKNIHDIGIKMLKKILHFS